ncbi:carbohydrate ABC transporter permease [Celerinatantimonas diazotrophica]|uniref:sn-glycerol-3-phosphate transport system permease protein UgpE n=1 Tax=Celerinatantimonas diazotrophica TaxID=412034 RepID=A0A4R1J788_9GAMM|nr:carbohydrate ABC transporter permease [Celerinatantimonas diazotrophica]TCK46322.1 carbohydrate ABC transporter membrane protein 2 (CUT1 family) [Celerinatantimonas diazotrophica]CAG9295304.1 L-arabinose transport system permease protein AraQ [Celerinatantimonas diazotrophica]
MYPQPIQKAGRFANISYRVALPISIVLWLLPLIAVLMTSIRSIQDINAGNYWGWPTHIQLWQNYSQVFTSTRMGQYLLNSLIITIPAVIGAVVLSTLAGFALSKYRFRGKTLIFAVFIAGNFVPFQILMIPVRNITIALGLYDTYWALIIFHIAFQSGFCTLFMRNFMVGIPDALIEAARVEGVSEWNIFRHVVVPLVRPALAALSVLVFTFIWNDYFWALVLVQSDDVRPVTAGLSSLQGQWLASWQLMSAGAIIAAIPPVILFFTMQRHFIAGLTLGATKG